MSTSAGLGRPHSLPIDVVEAREQLAALLRERGWPGDRGAAQLAVHEALVNAGQHGGGLRQVTAALDGEVLVVEVLDGGDGFEPGPYLYREPEPLAQRGRGLWMIGQLADSVRVQAHPGGTRVQLLFEPGPLPADAPWILPPEPELAALVEAAAALVEGVDAALLLVDDQLVVRDASPALAELFGLPRAQLVQRDLRGVLTEVAPRFASPSAFSARALHLAARPTQRSDDLLALADGRHLRATSVPLQNGSGRAIGRMDLFVPLDPPAD